MAELHIALCKIIDTYNRTPAYNGNGLVIDRFYDHLANAIVRRGSTDENTVRDALQDFFQGARREVSQKALDDRQAAQVRTTCLPAHPKKLSNGGECMEWHENVQYGKFTQRVLVGEHQFCNQHQHGGNNVLCCKYCGGGDLFRNEFCYDCKDKHQIDDGGKEWIDLYRPRLKMGQSPHASLRERMQDADTIHQ